MKGCLGGLKDSRCLWSINIGHSKPAGLNDWKRLWSIGQSQGPAAGAEKLNPPECRRRDYSGQSAQSLTTGAHDGEKDTLTRE
jgi:hypothetical protein